MYGQISYQGMKQSEDMISSKVTVYVKGVDCRIALQLPLNISPNAPLGPLYLSINIILENENLENGGSEFQMYKSSTTPLGYGQHRR